MSTEVPEAGETLISDDKDGNLDPNLNKTPFPSVAPGLHLTPQYRSVAKKILLVVDHVNETPNI